MKHTLLALAVTASLLHAQGPLTPPGAPAPTMKTLAQIEPRTPISSLPFMINAPGSYFLTGNLTHTDASLGSAIEIRASGVTLDLSGFTLKVTAATNAVFIDSAAPDSSEIVIQNGHIAGPVTRTSGTTPWTHTYSPQGNLNAGILLSLGSQSLQVRQLTLSGFGYGINAAGTPNPSIPSTTLTVTHTHIRDCERVGVGNSLITSIGPSFSTNSRARISDVTVTGCGFGIAYNNSVIANAQLLRNTRDGLNGNSNVVTDSSSIENRDSGFFGTGSSYRNVVANLNENGIFGDGVNVDGATLGGNRSQAITGMNCVLRSIKASGNATGPIKFAAIAVPNSTLTDVVSDTNGGAGISAPSSILTNCRAFDAPSGFFDIVWSGKAFNCLAGTASPALP